MPEMLRCSLVLALLGAASAKLHGVFVNGATGNQTAANGLYLATDVKENGHNCFKKEHMELWLCMDSNHRWGVQAGSLRGGDQDLIASTITNAESPMDAGKWEKWSDKKCDWVIDQGVTITPYTPPGAKNFVPPSATVETEDMLLRQTVAMLLMAAFVLGMISLTLATSGDGHIRSYFFKLMSATMTFLIALLWAQAVADLLFQQILPAPIPFGFGLGFPVSPGVKIVASFILFTLSYMALNIFGWKVQFSRARLYVLHTLGAHIAACFGIIAFTTIHHETVFAAWMQFQGPLLDPDAARIFTAFMVVAIAWYTFWVYRAAGIGARKEYLEQPPIKPWPAPVQPPLAAASETPRRPDSCTNFWATAPPAPVIVKKPPGPNWGKFVDTAEDDAAVIILGYLLSQTINYCATGELPGLKMVYTYSSTDIVKFWMIALACVWVTMLIVMCIRSRYGDGGRPGSILNRTLAMTFAWCVYRAATWATSGCLDDNHPLKAAQGAFAITIVAIVVMILADKLLDCMLGRNGSPGLKYMMANFPDNDMSLLERAMRILMNCMGMLVALSWEQAIAFSVETTVMNTEILADHVVISKAVIYLVLGVCMVRPWRRIILPTSEMSEPHIEEIIKHERMQMNRAEDFVPLAMA